ncbi:hypothetical protein M8C21_012128 [Ambrosia artemisiifolia]|uniref:STAS domain-containing protein n=1 Tax=Ambrosia artemisiifolia TaxID=4212 RepID=A0AAD5CB49_AMBAR|nr:hypothetical protein M8C21_012128 [Ambrosia artemisiifolia]
MVAERFKKLEDTWVMDWKWIRKPRNGEEMQEMAVLTRLMAGKDLCSGRDVQTCCGSGQPNKVFSVGALKAAMIGDQQQIDAGVFLGQMGSDKMDLVFSPSTTDWSLGQRFESSIIKHAPFSWPVSRVGYQDRHHYRIAVGRTFAALNDYQVDWEQRNDSHWSNEYGWFLFLLLCSFSRSAVNANAGAKTVVSIIIMASTVLVTLLFLMPLFYYTPNLILAAIIITGVIWLIYYQSALRLWKVNKLDFVAFLSSFFGVLMISVPMGLAIVVGVLVFKILLHVTRPNTCVLGNITGAQIYQNVTRYKEAKRVLYFVILSIEALIYSANSTYIEALIYSANSTYLQERILRWIREEEEWLAANNGTSIKCVVIDMTAVIGIDTSGLAMEKELRKMLEKRSLQLALANPGDTVMEKLHQTNILESFNSGWKVCI